MIKQIEIKNFQSHKKTVLDLTDGVNVIIGLSDSGKSSVLRAVNWVLFNRPLGDRFRSEWGGDTSVTLHTIEGNIIQRKRTASTNEYVLNGESLKAFGTEVPNEVLDILQMDFFNVQNQMDTPFLLANTAGEAAKILNRAASLEDIDETVGGLKRELYRGNQELERQKEVHETTSQQMLRFEGLDELEKTMSKVIEQEKTFNRLMLQKQSIQHLIYSIQNIEIGLEKTLEIPKMYEQWEVLNQIYRDFQWKRTKQIRIRNLTDDIFQKETEFQNTKNIDLVLKKFHKLTKIHNTYLESMKKQQRLKTIFNNIVHQTRELLVLSKEIATLKKEYEKLMPDICPLCDRLISKRLIKNEKN